MRTARGYRLRGTARHRIKVVDETGAWVWRHLSDLRTGDRVPLALDQLVGEPQEVLLPLLAEAHWTRDIYVRVPRVLTAELAELVGYFMGDGSLHAKGLRFCVSIEDIDVVNHLLLLGKELFGLEAAVSLKPGYTEVAFHSVRLAMWWEACGFAKHVPHEGHSGKGYVPHVPDAVLLLQRPRGVCRLPPRPVRSGRHGDSSDPDLGDGQGELRRRGAVAAPRSRVPDGAQVRHERTGFAPHVVATPQHLVPHALARRDRLHRCSEVGEGDLQRRSSGRSAGPHPGDARARRSARSRRTTGCARCCSWKSSEDVCPVEWRPNCTSSPTTPSSATCSPSSTTPWRLWISVTKSSRTTCRCRTTSPMSRTAS